MKKGDFGFMPLVSVIVPVYNVENYLNECVDSILQQSYDNLEVILVDDGSQDNCPKICEEYAKHDIRVKVVHKKNEGLGLARNSGLDIASGYFVTFVDSDDTLPKKAIEILVKNLIENNAQFCKGEYQRFNGNRFIKGKAIASGVFINDAIEEGIIARMLGSSPEKSDSIEMSVWATIYDRKIIDDNNLRFESERVWISEDLMFNLPYLKLCNKAVLVSELVYNYRITPGSLTNKYPIEKFHKLNEYYHELTRRYPAITQKYEYRITRRLLVSARSCIRNQFLNNDNNRQSRRQNIREICNIFETEKRFDSYPINLLPIKQQIFTRLLKYKASTILYLLAKAKLV